MRASDRARVALDEGREGDSKDDLVALLYLSRRSAIDGALVQVMIGLSVEDLVVSFIAGKLHQFTPAALRELSTAFDAAPQRITIADAVKTERELSEIFEDFIAIVPMGTRLFAKLNPVRTGGPMQVSIEFAEGQSWTKHKFKPHNLFDPRRLVFKERGRKKNRPAA